MNTSLANGKFIGLLWFETTKSTDQGAFGAEGSPRFGSPEKLAPGVVGSCEHAAGLQSAGPVLISPE